MSEVDRVGAADRANARMGQAQLELLLAILDVERGEEWLDDGARDLAHWVSMRYGISHWKACRWIDAAHAFEVLPALAQALRDGVLSIDKVVELARFATAEAETELIEWAIDVSPGAIRKRADVEMKRDRDDAIDPERSRSIEWGYFDEGRRFGMEVELPAADGAKVMDAIERLSRTIPVMPDEDGSASARRADALVAMCSGGVVGEAARATVVVHAKLDGLVAGTHGGELEDGPAIHPTVVERLLCTASVQTVVEDERGDVVRLGELSRLAPAWMERQVRYRDGGCRFPGCGSRRFTEAHHIKWWRDGGATTLENLALICTFHHRLVHEHGWRLDRDEGGDLRWRRPSGERMRAGPAPPRQLERSA